MNTEQSEVKKASRISTPRLKQERERHGWTQSQLAERIGTTQINVSRWENGTTVPGPYYRQKLGELFGKSLHELGLIAEVKERSSDLATAGIPPSIPQAIWNIPYRRNPFFTGREEILDYLSTLLSANKVAALTQTQVISGLGGIGKTQIAVEYAYRYSERYETVLWATASSRHTLVADFMKLASLLDLPAPNEQEQDIVIAEVKRWLTTHKNWLLILDNVDDLKMIIDFLPMQSEGNVLLTTRLQASGSLTKNIEVEKMEMQEGMLFLLRRAKMLTSDASLAQSRQAVQNQAEEIVNTLGGLPLALDQAGAYIEETRCGLQGYLDLYRTRRKELLRRRGTQSTDHPQPVTTTWSLSFEQIQEHSPAADLLRLCAFLQAEAIPEEIIIEGAMELGPALSSIATDPLALNETIEHLLRYSLIRRSPEQQVLSIHRLVQAVLKDEIDNNLRRVWAERATRAVNRAFPEVEQATWFRCQRCLPHAQIASTHIEEYGLIFPEAARLLNQAATYLMAHAHYTQVEITLNDLGKFYYIEGRYQQAEPFLRQAFAIREKALGADHPDTATSLNNLALLYHAQGKYREAEKYFLQALHIRQRVLAPEHPDIARNLSHLAELYTVQGQYKQAEALYSTVLSMQRKVLGPDHLDVAETLNNLALVYHARGVYGQAESLYLQALDIQEKALGQNHPSGAQTLNDLARLYRAQGEYAKAETFYEQALHIRKAVFGSDHPHVAQSLYSLAKLYHSQGRYLQAEELCLEALRIQEQKLGTAHPDIAYTLSTLANLYQGQHQYAQAEALYQRALALRESTLGKEHPHVALILSSLAEVYQAQGQYHQAKPLITRSLAIREGTLGQGHPYTAFSLSNLAEIHFAEGDYIQAKLLYEEARTIREQALGPAHPYTASTYDDLAKVYLTLGQYEEAESFYKKALSIREETLGAEHPDVAISLEHYAHLLRQTEREHIANKLEVQAKEIRDRQTK